MGEILAKLGNGNIFWLTVVGGAVLYGVVATVTQAWRRVRVTEIEAALKQQMLDRGMSADDIVQVMRVRSNNAPNTEAATADDGRNQLVENLVENGMSSEDIERILKAMHHANGQLPPKVESASHETGSFAGRK
jgi:hypothetical protein